MISCGETSNGCLVAWDTEPRLGSGPKPDSLESEYFPGDGTEAEMEPEPGYFLLSRDSAGVRQNFPGSVDLSLEPELQPPEPYHFQET